VESAAFAVGTAIAMHWAKSNRDKKMTYQVKIEEDLDANTVEAMRVELDRLAAMTDDLEIDMTQVRFMDSSGIGAIIFLFKRSRARGYKICVTGLSGQPLKLMQHLGIANLVADQPQRAA
jgi:anti-anti-sigma factor